MLFDGLDFSNLIYIRLDSPLDVIKAIVEILMLTYFFYAVLNIFRETMAWQLLKGVMLILAITAIANLANLRTLSFILNNTFSVLAIGMVVVFQPELRRGLEQIGRSALNVFFSAEAGQSTYNMINAVVHACVEMSKEKTGALIVIERRTKLGEIIDTGILLGADISAELLINIFTKNTPLHDGAVVIRDARIEAATCYLPLTEGMDINKEFGTRHRAAIGMSEISDALVIVVSEETGRITFIRDGAIERGLGEDQLRQLLIMNLTVAASPDRRKLFLGAARNRK